MKITFIPSSQFVADNIPCPKPASTYLPDWYRQADSGTHQFHLLPDNRPEVSYKACMPFRDALTSGYIQETWCDLYVQAEDGGLKFYYSTDPQLCDVRQPNGVAKLPTDTGLNPWEMTWKQPWIPKLPKGWSILVTSPFNRLDLPFVVTSGVIDADRFYHSPWGNVPFYVRENFSGVIPCGTPMYQMIPFKREAWQTSTETFNERESSARLYSVVRHMMNRYRDHFWQPKRYK